MFPFIVIKKYCSGELYLQDYNTTFTVYLTNGVWERMESVVHIHIAYPLSLWDKDIVSDRSSAQELQLYIFLTTKFLCQNRRFEDMQLHQIFKKKLILDSLINEMHVHCIIQFLSPKEKIMSIYLGKIIQASH